MNGSTKLRKKDSFVEKYFDDKAIIAVETAAYIKNEFFKNTGKLIAIDSNDYEMDFNLFFITSLIMLDDDISNCLSRDGFNLKSISSYLKIDLKSISDKMPVLNDGLKYYTEYDREINYTLTQIYNYMNDNKSKISSYDILNVLFEIHNMSWYSLSKKISGIGHFYPYSNTYNYIKEFNNQNIKIKELHYNINRFPKEKDN